MKHRGIRRKNDGSNIDKQEEGKPWDSFTNGKDLERVETANNNVLTNNIILPAGARMKKPVTRDTGPAPSKPAGDKGPAPPKPAGDKGPAPPKKPAGERQKKPDNKNNHGRLGGQGSGGNKLNVAMVANKLVMISLVDVEKRMMGVENKALVKIMVVKKGQAKITKKRIKAKTQQVSTV